VEQIQRTLTPDANVCFDEKIMGNLSGALRQFDVTVRREGVLTVFDCKDYKNRVDVKDVEQFIGMVADIGANRAVMVSAKGFSKSALNRGKAAGLDLFTVVDAEKHDWQTVTTIPVLEECWVIEASRWKTTCNAIETLVPEGTERSLLGAITLYDVAMKALGTLHDLLNARIAAIPSLRTPGQHADIELFEGPTFAKTEDGEIVSVHAQADIRVREDLYIHIVPLTHIQGFQNAVTGNIHTRGFITEWIDMNSLPETTVQISSRAMLAINPMFIFTTSKNTF